MPTSSNHNFCLNCNTPFAKSPTKDKEVYCTECGQSSKARSMSLILLIKDAFSNIFNLDGRLFHTLRDLIYPSKLTKTYIAGKKKYYVNPARLFIFTLIIFISLGLSIAEMESTSTAYRDMVKRVDHSIQLDKYDKLMDTLEVPIDTITRDTIRKRLFRGVAKVENDTISNHELSIYRTDTNEANVDGKGMTYYDMIHMSNSELFKKYEISGYWNQLMIKQYINFTKNQKGAIQYMIKNMVWAVFFSAIFISLLVGLLYARSDYHLIEHGVLVLNFHSFMFFYLSLLILSFKVLNLIYPFVYDITILKGWPTATIFSCIFIFQFLSLKKYYKQGVLKTLLKQFIINASYLIFFIIIATSVGLISALIF